MTEKLYDLDPYAKEFDAAVISCGEVTLPVFKETLKQIEKNGHSGPDTKYYEIILDKTVFFPEGGGQSSDVGVLRSGETGCTVLDVRTSGDSVVHLISAAADSTASQTGTNSAALPFEPGTPVHGSIDWAKRFERMQQHSGEHLLSGSVYRRFGYSNTGFHLSDNGTTVDFNGTFTDEDLKEIEDEVNGIILKDVPCHIYYPSSEELAGLTYRSKKELEGPVRIVEFGIYDTCACCAPHVGSTIEIGLFKILTSEHFRGGTRMTIACGQRLLEELRLLQKNNRAISQILSVRPEQTADGVEKLNESYKKLKFEAIRIEKEMLELTVKYAEKPVLFLENAEAANIRAAVNALSSRFGGYCAGFTGNDENGYNYIITSADEDCTALLGRMKAELKASGGGSRTMIQGNVHATRAELLGFITKGAIS